MTMTSIKALIAIGLTCGMAMPAAAQKHVALVLDNGRIQPAAALQAAPATPSARIVEGLERMRYRVIVGRQQDQAGMRRYINEFRGALNDAEVALFYFKGVTLDSSGRNLLIANNAAPGRPIDQSAVPLDEIADLMNASRANVLLIDAGYADRTAESLARSATGLSPTMARLRDRSRFMVAFANMPGKLARSDTDSPFAELLASYLTGNDLTSADLGQQLRQDMFERTRGSQLPWVRSDLGAVRLAALPESPTPALLDTPATPTLDRGTLIRAVQLELKRHQCYTGSINGSAALTDMGLDKLGKTEIGKRSPYIAVTRAKAEDFEGWLDWVRAIQEPICKPSAAPAVYAPKAVPSAQRRPVHRDHVIVKQRHPKAAPRHRQSQDSVSHTGIIGRGKGDYFAPSNPFYAPSR